MVKKMTGLALAVIILVLALTAPPMFGLTGPAQKTLGVLLAGIFLWVLEVMPLSVTALLVIILQPLLNIADIGTALTNFATPVVFFVMASFGMSLAITKTPLAFRLIRRLFKFSGNDSQKILLVFMVSSALLSSIMSNVPVTSLFMGLAMGILGKMEQGEQSRKFGKVVMIAIPFAGMIGGIMTPAGSSINVLTLDLLERYAGIQVSFLEWMVYGLPIAVVLTPLCWYVLVKMFKPEDIRQEIIDNFLHSEEIGRLSKQEIKVLVIVVAMIILWIAGSWVPVLNLTVVALAGLILFFAPGINVLTWEEYARGVSWEAVIMIGGVLSIGSAAIEVGLGQWFMDIFLRNYEPLSLPLLLFIMGIIIAILHLPLPIAPAIVTVAVSPLCGLAVSSGFNPLLLIVPLAFFAGSCLLVPLDAVPLITYSQGYYTMKDMFLSGALTTLIWVILAAAWIPVAGKLLNVY